MAIVRYRRAVPATTPILVNSSWKIKPKPNVRTTIKKTKDYKNNYFITR